MLHKTKGIVLGHVKYGESSLIIQIYTEKFGIQSYIENGVRKAKAKHKMAIFQPLTLLDLVVYKKSNSSINRMSEIKVNPPYRTIPYEIIKSSIGLFLAEFLNHILRGEEDENPMMFGFIHDSFTYFDQKEESYVNFHLQFLAQLSSYLGFKPSGAVEIMDELSQYHQIKLRPDEMLKLEELLDNDLTYDLKITAEQRQQLLNVLIQFYQIHSHSFKEIKSLRVLHEVLS
ncbi:DNA repair protein RecO [uncultured Marivirga sp.]|uniref:DNA repair protein RecO n=1 Tax=uncultured Marivirga sp. TaxID=1123707 RepID=UPI0030EDD67C|tara:strand:+ start:142860 stop:143549 length:690 start_codon:yes stop_codon:yes gene_type:complete